MNFIPKTFTLTSLALAVLGTCGGAHAQSTAELAAELRALRAELMRVRGELDALKVPQAQATAPAPAVGQGGAWQAVPAITTAASSSPVASTATMPGEGVSANPLSLFGYGEMSFGRPLRNAADSTATVRRGVLGFAYRFNERTRMAAELEVENAVVSASDKGEVAFEQLYIEHDLNERVSAKAGLFLMPVGYLNEVHEPTRYFGVNRNLIETAIIPSTWREMGVGLKGTTAAGLRWDAGVVTSFDLTKWDASGNDGRNSPLGAIHQEGQLAKARSLGTYGALNYNGIPGFNAGGSLFVGGVGHKQPGFAAPNASLSLGEVHARWQPGKWDLSALAASGSLRNVEALNATFVGQPTPVPSSFGGWYTQAAYRLWSQGDYALVPFMRYERLNTARGYDGFAPGLAPAAAADTRAWTAGASFYLHPQVVVKLDVQRYLSDKALDRLNLGVGFHF